MTTLSVIVRTDIPVGRQLAQVAHAAFTWAARHGPHHGVIHVYAADRLASLEYACEMAALDGARIMVWREPDLKNEITAVATDATDISLPLHSR